MTNDMAKQFDLLGKEIVKSINVKDYVRATMLDQARQQMLHELALIDPKTLDNDFFSMVEDAARENSKLIADVQKDMDHINWKTSKSLKIHRAYRESF
jgi:hypothetical protein